MHIYIYVHACVVLSVTVDCKIKVEFSITRNDTLCINLFKYDILHSNLLFFEVYVLCLFFRGVVVNIKGATE